MSETGETKLPKVTDFGTPDDIEGLKSLARLAEIEMESVLSEFIKRLPSGVELTGVDVYVDGRYMTDGQRVYFHPEVRMRVGLQAEPFRKPPPPPRPKPDVMMG